jgi:hypothetical protein
MKLASKFKVAKTSKKRVKLVVDQYNPAISEKDLLFGGKIKDQEVSELLQVVKAIKKRF